MWNLLSVVLDVKYYETILNEPEFICWKLFLNQAFERSMLQNGKAITLPSRGMVSSNHFSIGKHTQLLLEWFLYSSESLSDLLIDEFLLIPTTLRVFQYFDIRQFTTPIVSLLPI